MSEDQTRILSLSWLSSLTFDPYALNEFNSSVICFVFIQSIFCGHWHKIAFTSNVCKQYACVVMWMCQICRIMLWEAQTF